jgi:hypothetical protein
MRAELVAALAACPTPAPRPEPAPDADTVMLLGSTKMKG